MTVEQINEFINSGGAALALTIIAFAVVYYVFGHETQTSSKKNP